MRSARFLLGHGKDAVAETVAEAVQRPLDALDIRKIGADAEDHFRLTPPVA